MTVEERTVMEQHVVYWSEQAVKGIAVVFGPVMDPNGVYGIGIFRVRDEAEMKDLLSHDPANGLLHYTIYPMPRLVVGTPAGSIG